MSRFKFDARFQKAALMRLITEPSMLAKFREFLSPKLFHIEDTHGCLQRIAKVVLEKSAKEDVSVEGVWAWLQMLPNGPEREETRLMFEDMRYDAELLQFARSEQVFLCFLEFVKAQAFLASHGEIKTSFDKGDYEHAYQKLEVTLNKLRGIGMEDDEIINWESQLAKLGSVTDTKFLNFNLGVADFDEVAGFEPQSFNIFLGASGGGKSMMSIHLLVQAVKQGKHAFAVFVEDKSKTIMNRLYACYTGLPTNMIKQNALHMMSSEHRKLMKEANEKFAKFLHIEYIYGKGHKYIIQKVKQHQENLRIAGEPLVDILVLDYVGHIGHLAEGDTSHEKLHRACADLKNFALQSGIITFTHFQVNRSGAQKQNDGTGLIDTASIAGSFNAVFVADNVIAINRTEELKSREACILAVLKGREGAADRKYEVKTNFASAQYVLSGALNLTFQPH